MTKPAPENIIEETQAQLSQAIWPWPSISPNPTRELEDGRFVKSHPIEFPMGTGDLRQARLRSDFSPADWVQHIFRYFTGHFLTSVRGHRVVWALFNTALREISREKGSIVHKRTNASVITKEELRDGEQPWATALTGVDEATQAPFAQVCDQKGGP